VARSRRQWGSVRSLAAGKRGQLAGDQGSSSRSIRSRVSAGVPQPASRSSVSGSLPSRSVSAARISSAERPAAEMRNTCLKRAS
jgi:hypothetical protein